MDLPINYNNTAAPKGHVGIASSALVTSLTININVSGQALFY